MHHTSITDFVQALNPMEKKVLSETWDVTAPSDQTRHIKSSTNTSLDKHKPWQTHGYRKISFLSLLSRSFVRSSVSWNEMKKKEKNNDKRTTPKSTQRCRLGSAHAHVLTPKLQWSFSFRPTGKGWRYLFNRKQGIQEGWRNSVKDKVKSCCSILFCRYATIWIDMELG